MIALEILLDIVLFCVLTTGMWWTGTRSVVTETSKADHEPAPEAESEYECDDCGGSVTSIDHYPHDGATVEIVRCAACTRRGTLIHHPDGHTAGDGIVAEQADEQIHTVTLSDCWQAVQTGVTRTFGLLKRLYGGLKRLSQWLGSRSEGQEKPCAESLECDHEGETRDGNVEECDDPSCDLLHVEEMCVDCGAHLGWRDAPREECDVILPGDRFEGPTDRVWDVADPWLPVESPEGLVPCILLEARENGGEWCVACEMFEDWLEEGTFSPVEEQAEEPETVAADGGAPVGGDGLGTVLNRLQCDYSSALVWMHDNEAEHLTYFGESTESLDTAVLSYLLVEGFEILDAGAKECPATGQEQACVEIRREPARRNGGEA